MLLQNHRRITATELAQRLEVSTRTVLRDIEVLSGSGVPVYAVRGPQGGFELLDTYRQQLTTVPRGLSTEHGRLRRVRVRLSPAALQLAVVLGKPEAWRPRPPSDGGHGHDRPDDWVEGSFRFTSYDSAVRELLALGPEVEVLLPDELRQAMADIGRRITHLHS